MPRPTPPPAIHAPVDDPAEPDEVVRYLTEVMRDGDEDTRLRLRAAELLGRHLGLYKDREGIDFRDLAEEIEAARARLAAQSAADAERAAGGRDRRR